MRIRKQVYDLTLCDFEEFPVWEYALDEECEEGQDEATVRPYQPSGELDPADGMFVFRAVFTLADGTKMTGYMTPPSPDDDSLGILQPAIITDRGQVSFWYGAARPDEAELALNYERLGRDAAHVFPLQVESQVQLVGGPVRAMVPGFLVLEDWEAGTTRTIT
jgi:hypothetical protein